MATAWSPTACHVSGSHASWNESNSAVRQRRVPLGPSRLQQEVAERRVVVAFLVVGAGRPLATLRSELMAGPVKVVDGGPNILASLGTNDVRKLVGERRFSGGRAPIDRHARRMVEPQ